MDMTTPALVSPGLACTSELSIAMSSLSSFQFSLLKDFTKNLNWGQCSVVMMDMTESTVRQERRVINTVLNHVQAYTKTTKTKQKTLK